MVIISMDDEDSLVCKCGNTPNMAGFFPCDENGDEMEPIEGWNGLYVCDSCGAILNGDTKQIVGHRKK